MCEWNTLPQWDICTTPPPQGSQTTEEEGGGKIGGTREQREWDLLGTTGLGIHEPTTAMVA